MIPRRMKSIRARPEISLSVANAVAQFCIFAATPIYSRLFTPEELGLAAAVIATIQVFSIAAALRYDLAIMNATTTALAYTIFRTSLVIVLGTSAMSAAVFSLASVFSNGIHYGYIAIPFGVLLIGAFQSGSYWFTRERQFKTLAFAKILQAIIGATTPIALHFSGVGFVAIIIGFIFTKSLGALVFAYSLLSDPPKIRMGKRKNLSTWSILKKYRSFPFFAAPQAFVNTASMVMAPIILGFYGLVELAGYFWLADRVLMGSVAVFSISFGQVLLSNLHGKTQPKQIQPFVIDSHKELLLIGPPLILFIACALNKYSSAFFGDNWGYIGHLALVLAPAIAVQFLASPLSVIVGLRGKNKENLFWHIFGFAIRAVPLALSCYLQSAYIFEIYAATSLIFYLLYTFWLLSLVDISLADYMRHFKRQVILTAVTSCGSVLIWEVPAALTGSTL